MKRAAILLLLAATAACGRDAAEKAGPADRSQEATTLQAPSPTPPSAPQTSPSANSGEQTSATGLDTRAVTQAYFDAIASREYQAAWALRWKGEGDGTESWEAFRDAYDLYAEHHATVGIPGPVEGAAGSLYVEVPVQLYGRMKSGEPFSSAGTVTLRRVNDVPGSTAEQRRWRIYSRD